jgi:hypothetical protein
MPRLLLRWQVAGPFRKQLERQRQSELAFAPALSLTVSGHCRYNEAPRVMLNKRKKTI